MGLFDKLKNAVPQFGGFSPFGGSNENDEAEINKPQQSQAPAQAPAPQPTSVADGLYPPQLEKLINIALADGEISDSERQILHRKAAEFGVDADELDMVLEGRIHERKNQAAAAAVSAAPKSNKYGDIRKCPACGATVPAFTAKCPECGLEFNVSETNQTIERLFEMLNNVVETEKEASFFSSLATGANQSTVNRKKSIIQNFPVPTSKNDILEFLTLAVPQAKYKTFMGQPLNDPSDPEKFYLGPVWKSKCEQIIMKAKIVLKDDKEALAIIKGYAEELKIKF